MKKLAASGLILLLLTRVEPSATQVPGKADDYQMLSVNETKLNEWLWLWERSILREDAMQHCSADSGEELGWKMSPLLKGFYNGYIATGNILWVHRLVACADTWLKRAVKEPDGYLGWPKVGAAGTEVDGLDSFYADSMLGEAMALTPIVLMAAAIRKTPSLAEKYGSRAEDYILFSEQIFSKWQARGAWRETDSGAGISVELPFGIEQKTGKWTGEYGRRNVLEVGFSHPDNKANLIAAWLLAMFDATGNAIYSERAERWFQTMKSRMKQKSDGTYEIWSYWEPAGAWDYKSNAFPKHWIGVHPNPGYYEIDVAAIVAAYDHHLVFNREDLNLLINTAIQDERYWTALVPFDSRVQRHFESSVNPVSWGALTTIPWYAAIQRNRQHQPKQGQTGVRAIL